MRRPRGRATTRVPRSTGDQGDACVAPTTTLVLARRWSSHQFLTGTPLDPALGFHVRRTISIEGMTCTLAPVRTTSFENGDAELVADAIARARAIAEAPGGDAAAAALLAATSTVLDKRMLVWALRRQ